MQEQSIAGRVSFAQVIVHAPGEEMTWSQARKATDPDAALVDSLRAQMPMAFDNLVRRHERRLLNVALRVTNNREDAEDVVQESFLKVFRRLESFRGDSRFATWLTRITINQALMTVRTHTRKFISLHDSLETEDHIVIKEIKARELTPEQLYAQSEFKRLVFDRSAGMKPLSRWVFELRVADLSEVEIAQITGLTVSAVKTKLCRARRELRKRIDQYLLSAKMLRIKRTKARGMPDTNESDHSHCQSHFSPPGSLSASDLSSPAVT